MKTHTYTLLSVFAVLCSAVILTALPFKVSHAQSTSTPPVISSIVASSTADGKGEIITWVTDVPADSQVSFGETATYGIQFNDAGLVTNHTISLIPPAEELVPGATYHFQVMSTNASGTSATSSDQTFTTANPVEVPPVISAINASSTADGTGETITWVTDIAANSQVSYGTTTSYGTSEINVTQVTNHSVGLTDLVPGTLYHFQILSANESGTVFATSSDQTFTTASPVVTPVPAPVISNIVASSTASGTGVTISWLTDVGATSQVAIGPTINYIATSTLGSSLVTNHAVAFIGLVPGTTYHFQVMSANASGTLATSSDQVFTSANPVVTPPVAPVISDVVALSSTDGTGAAVSWTTDVLSNSQVAYGTSSDYTASSTVDASMVTSHFIELAGLTPSTLYHFQVMSTNASGTLATSSDQTFTTATPVVTPPAAPVISSIVASSTSNGTGATVTWLTDVGATSQVAYGTTSLYTASSTLDSTLLTNHTVALTGLAPGTLYHFQVMSTNASGTSATSSDQTFTTSISGGGGGGGTPSPVDIQGLRASVQQFRDEVKTSRDQLREKVQGIRDQFKALRESLHN